MKKFKYYSFAAALIFLVSACNKMDLAPEDWYGSNNFWNNEAQVKGFIYGVHKQIRDQNVNFWLMGEARGGTLKYGTGVSTTSVSMNYISPFIDQGFTKDKAGISSWANMYGSILNVNEAITQIETGCTFLSKASHDYYLGQLYGIRSFYYFWLYRTWGGVPLITEPKVMNGESSASALYAERATPKATLDFIKTDINKSETLFGTNNTMTDAKSVWSLYATEMLKAEIYLWSAKVTTGARYPVPPFTSLTVSGSAL